MKQKICKTVIGLVIIAVIQVSSIVLVNLLKLNFPPSLFGMILLSLLLYFKIIPMKLVKDACDVLLDNMVLFFVPVTIGIILYQEMLAANFIVLAVVISVSTIVTMVFSAYVSDYFIDRKLRKLNK